MGKHQWVSRREQLEDTGGTAVVFVDNAREMLWLTPDGEALLAEALLHVVLVDIVLDLPVDRKVLLRRGTDAYGGCGQGRE